MVIDPAIDAANPLSPITGEFRNGIAEHKFRKQQMPEIRRHAKAIMALGAIISILFLLPGLAFSQPISFDVIMARGIAAGYSICCLLVVDRLPHRRVEQLLVAWQAGILLSAATIVAERQETALTSLLVLPAIFYLAVPTNFRSTVIMGWASSAILFSAYVGPGGPSVYDLRLGLGLAVFNILLSVLKSRSGQLLRSHWAVARSAKRNLAELAQSRRLLERTFDAVPIPVVVTSIATGNIVMANESAERFLEVPQGGLINRKATEFYANPADRAELTERLGNEGDVRDFRSTMRTTGGRLRSVLLAGSRVSGRLADDDATMVASVLDITDQEERERQLRLAEAEYRALFENAVVGIYRSTPAGKMLRANPALVRLNGYETEIELVSAVNDIASEWYVEPGRRDEWLALMRQEGRVTDFVSEVYRHKSRERIWISENGWAFFDDNGEPEYFEGTLIEITERKRAEAKIERMALYDPLTDLPNRRKLVERLDGAVAAFRRDGVGFAVMCLDLDRFKQVNDAFGHEAGDLVLQGAARRIKAECRTGDTVARVGGDEFTILVNGVGDTRVLAQLARRILAAFGKPFDIGGQRAMVGTSIGIAVAPSDGVDPTIVIRKADLALYSAKRSRNAFQFSGDCADEAELEPLRGLAS